MSKHFFGIKLGDQRGRFYKEFTDQEFDALVFGQLGGRLPVGVFAWHLGDNEDITNSLRVQEIGKLPIVTSSWGGYWIEPEEALVKMARDEERAGIRQETGQTAGI